MSPILGWSGLSVATLIVVFRPDAAAIYLPLVLVALVASIVSLAARRLAHGLAMLGCVLLMPAVIAESVTVTQLATTVSPPDTDARRRQPDAPSPSSNEDSDAIVGVSFVDTEDRGLAAPSTTPDCRDRDAASNAPASPRQRRCGPEGD